MVVLKDSIDKIKSFDVVISWISDLSKNSTVNYLNALAEFCKVNNLNPQEMLETIYQEEEQRLPSWERSINNWFENYDKYCKTQKRSINTRDVRRTIVNSFISFHELPTYTVNKRKRKSNGLKAPNKRDGLTKYDIKDLISVCKTWKMKAVVLAQASSGLTGVDILNLKVKDFDEGLIEVLDKKTKCKKRICQLQLVRIKTHKEFTTFISEEAVNAIERYLKLERNDPQSDDALFTASRAGRDHLSTVSLQQAYRNLNEYLGWEQKEIGQFRKATSHMMRKFFNTELINAGMPEEIREHFMGHQYKDKVRDAYFLANPKKLKEVYMNYMEELTIGIDKPAITKGEFIDLKIESEIMQKENMKLKKDLREIRKTIEDYKKIDSEIDEEVLAENTELRSAVTGLMYENEVHKNHLTELTDKLQSMRQEINNIKSHS